MKKKCIAKLLTVVAAVVSFSVVATAAPIVYTSQYVPTTLPQNTAGTIADPTWTLIESGSPSPSVSDNLLTVTTSSVQDAFWLISGGAWNNTGTTTVDFTVKILDSVGSFALFMGASNTGYSAINVFSTYVSMDQPVGGNLTYNMDNTNFQTFRLVTNGTSVSLYSAASATPIFANVDFSSSLQANQIYFGDASSGIGSSFQVAHIGWNNSVSEFSAPDAYPVPEPNMLSFFALAGAVSVVVIGMRRSRQTVA